MYSSEELTISGPANGSHSLDSIFIGQARLSCLAGPCAFATGDCQVVWKFVGNGWKWVWGGGAGWVKRPPPHVPRYLELMPSLLPPENPGVLGRHQRRYTAWHTKQWDRIRHRSPGPTQPSVRSHGDFQEMEFRTDRPPKEAGNYWQREPQFALPRGPQSPSTRPGRSPIEGGSLRGGGGEFGLVGGSLAKHVAACPPLPRASPPVGAGQWPGGAGRLAAGFPGSGFEVGASDEGASARLPEWVRVPRDGRMNVIPGPVRPHRCASERKTELVQDGWVRPGCLDPGARPSWCGKTSLVLDYDASLLTGVEVVLQRLKRLPTKKQCRGVGYDGHRWASKQNNWGAPVSHPVLLGVAPQLPSAGQCGIRSCPSVIRSVSYHLQRVGSRFLSIPGGGGGGGWMSRLPPVAPHQLPPAPIVR